MRASRRPTSALRRGGIQYVEIRSLDLNLADPVGINQNTMRFMEAFLVYCLLSDSPPMSDDEYGEILRNHTETAKRGRDPELALERNGNNVSLQATLSSAAMVRSGLPDDSRSATWARARFPLSRAAWCAAPAAI